MFFTCLNPKISFSCNRKQGTFLKKWRACSLAHGIKKSKLYYYYYYYLKKNFMCKPHDSEILMSQNFYFTDESLTGFNLIYDKKCGSILKIYKTKSIREFPKTLFILHCFSTLIITYLTWPTKSSVQARQCTTCTLQILSFSSPSAPNQPTHLQPKKQKSLDPQSY